MHLLHDSATPAQEFMSLSLLMRQEPTDDYALSMGEPLIIVSPMATISNGSAFDALQELHTHLTYVVKAAAASKLDSYHESLAVQLLKEDEQFLSRMQVFRPLCASGLGLHYRLIRNDSNAVYSLSSLVMTANKNGGRIDAPPGLEGIVVCVGVAGLPFAHSMPSLNHSLPQRVNDCVGILTRIGINDVSAAKSTLSAFLLFDDEFRKSNSMIEASNYLLFPEVEVSKTGMSPIDLINPIGVRKSRRASTKGGTSNEVGGVALSFNITSDETSKLMTEKLRVLSVAETDTFLRKYELSAQERKANIDLTGGAKSRQRRRKTTGRDADFDNFDYKGPVREAVVRQAAPTAFLAPPSDAGAKLRLSKKDTRSKGAVPVPALSASRTDAGTSRRTGPGLRPPTGDDGGPRRSSLSAFARARRENSTSGFDDEASEAIRSHSSAHDLNSVASLARVQVNIALNEDLSCSYRHSQLSSCSVEGVVQVQVKSNSRSAVPFYMFLRDPSAHIAALQENGKFTEDVSDELARDEEEAIADRKFVINVPKAESYFPVFKYKCAGVLRPVPIRVQTRIKSDKGFCRVALQISSNPNNKSSLTDLTIVMNVPEEVKGESLVTQPAGGVWDESKQSVVWFVSELGCGEKFQLQARFELANADAKEDPSFPVLVRCQCLFSQLSDIELEVREMADAAPAEVAMKMARRFRLSHRERS